MSDLLKLAERCEAATGPDRELDGAVHTAVTGFEPRRGGIGWPDNALVVPGFPGWVPLPAYTASIDAAMSLVPSGMEFGCGSKDDSGSAWAWVGKFHGPLNIEEGEPTSAALALCAAALRARSEAAAVGGR